MSERGNPSLSMEQIVTTLRSRILTSGKKSNESLGGLSGAWVVWDHSSPRFVYDVAGPLCAYCDRTTASIATLEKWMRPMLFMKSIRDLSRYTTICRA